MRLGDAKHAISLTRLPLIIKRVTIKLPKNCQCSAINVELTRVTKEKILRKEVADYS